MNLKSLGEAVALNAAAAQTALDLDNVTPFAEDFDAVAVISQDSGAGSFVVKVQTSPDDSTWTDVLTMTGAGPVAMAQVTLQRYARVDVSTAGSAGTVNAYLLV